MADNSRFLCCTRQQLTVLRCSRCRQLVGFCAACTTLFNNLKDPASALMLSTNQPIECPGCHFEFTTTDNWQKQQASQRDLVEAGLGQLSSEKFELKTGPKEDAPVENYRHKIDKLGWDGPARPRRRSSTTESSNSKKAGTSLPVKILTLLVVVGSLVGGYFYIYPLFFPPAPPKQIKTYGPNGKVVTKPVKK